MITVGMDAYAAIRGTTSHAFDLKIYTRTRMTSCRLIVAGVRCVVWMMLKEYHVSVKGVHLCRLMKYP